MDISLTTDGLRLNYRTTDQTSVSGTYPIGTMMLVGNLGSNSITLPGTWIGYGGKGITSNVYSGSSFPSYCFLIRVK